MTTKDYELDDEVLKALDWANVRDDGDGYTLSVSVPRADAPDYDERCDEIMEDIRSSLPAGWAAEWCGTGNTDADGDTTEDIHIWRTE